MRQSGSLLGIAVGGTIMSLAYRYAVDGSLSGYPEQVRAQAQISAEQARHAAATIHQPDLVRVANDAFIEAMHVSAAGTMLIALCGALLLAIALRPDRQPVEPVPQDTPVKSSL